MFAASCRFVVVALVFCVLSIRPDMGVVHAAEGEHDPAGGEEKSAAVVETVWTCSMHPQIQMPQAGQCPICFMDLIEVQKESAADRQSLRQISFDDRARKLAQVEVQPVTRGNTASRIRMVGKVDYDETRVGTITSWVDGRIDKLFVDYTGSHVRRGQPMAKIYSPELVTAQAELIQASSALKRTEDSSNEIIKKTARRTLEASREKLRLLGLSNSQLKAIEKQGKPTDHITLTAPLSGIVIKKDVNEGMYVKTGSRIYTLADLDKVWVILEAYESDLHGISLGQQVEFTVESYPGVIFKGEVAYIDPLVDSKTRTIRVRLNVANEDAKLKPGMFVRAVAANTGSLDPADAPLLIPVSAPLITGRRALVYVQVPAQEGVYVGREVILGPRRGAFYQVKNGLEEGELVVTRGNFKIDSAIQIQARPSLMNPYRETVPEKDTELPSLFISRLNLLNQIFAELSTQAHDAEQGISQQTLKQFSEKIGAIKGEELKGDAALSWQELSMLLNSDVILLQEAEGQKEMQQLYTTMSEHFHQLRKRFALDDAAAAHLGSDELRTKITALLGSYLDLQQHLAADNLEDARKDAAAITPLAKTVVAALEASGFEQASSLADQLAEDVRLLAAAATIEEVRTIFYPVSKTMAEVVEIFGSNLETPLYLQFCPMAFGNKGATWLAGSDEINNPYFGTMMLRCGEVRQQISQ